MCILSQVRRIPQAPYQRKNRFVFCYFVDNLFQFLEQTAFPCLVDLQMAHLCENLQFLPEHEQYF